MSTFTAHCRPFSVREGINIFLDGFIPTENLRFRAYDTFEHHTGTVSHRGFLSSASPTRAAVTV